MSNITFYSYKQLCPTVRHWLALQSFPLRTMAASHRLPTKYLLPSHQYQLQAPLATRTVWPIHSSTMLSSPNWPRTPVSMKSIAIVCQCWIVRKAKVPHPFNTPFFVNRRQPMNPPRPHQLRPLCRKLSQNKKLARSMFNFLNYFITAYTPSRC